MRIHKKSVVMVVAALLLSAVQAMAQVQPVVRVTTQIDDSTLTIGQTTQARVLAVVENGSLGDLQDDADGDGLFTFDFDVIFSNTGVIEVVPSTIVRAQNPFAGQDGTINASGIDAIGSGFNDDSVGIGGAALLFTFDVRAIGTGLTIITPGPDTDVFGTDLTLYSDAELDPSQKIYETGPTVVVTDETTPGGAIPEPMTAGLWSLSLLAVATVFARRPMRQIAFARV